MKTPSSLRPLIVTGVISLGAFLASSASAQILFSTNFDTAASYDNNFVKLAPSGTADLTWNAGGYLDKTGTGLQSVIFDTSAGVVPGGTQVNNDYSAVTVSSQFRLLSFNGPSMGLFASVNDANTSGYMGLINFVSSASVRLRIWDSNSSTVSSNSVGTLLSDQTFAVPTISTSLFYTGSFMAAPSVGTMDFNLSLFDSTGTTLIASLDGSDLTSPVTSGQVGIRTSSTSMYVDSFSVTPVPEPSQIGLMMVGGLALLTFVRRRRTSSVRIS